MSPVSSATGMNSPGGTRVYFGRQAQAMAENDAAVDPFLDSLPS